MTVREILKGRTTWIPSHDYDHTAPLVSVLLPTWKRAESGLFQAAVDSVLKQSLFNLELIIVDDCSTDGTFDLIREFMNKDSRVSCIRHTENIGLPAVSEFEAFQKAKGKYIAFIFDDNEWELDGLKKLVDYAEKKQVKAVAGQYRLFTGRPGDSFDDPSKWTLLGGSQVQVGNLAVGNCFGNAAVLLHRETIETVGFYDPNISVGRCWDWDLWIRISAVFQFDMIDELIGSEKGCGLEDSLGNTHQRYPWVQQERIHQPHNHELLPENYLDCDIFEPRLPSSQLFYQSICWLSKQVERKPWFRSDDPALCSVIQKSKTPWKGVRIAYLHASSIINASSSVNWGRLPYSEDYVIFYSTIPSLDYTNLIWADAIIIERAMGEQAQKILKWAKEKGIPCYYYTDDNFIVLVEDYKGTKYEQAMRNLSGKDCHGYDLRDFKGVFCSTKALMEYHLEKELHKEIWQMPPVFDSKQLQPFHPLTEPANLVFFGSEIRGEVLAEVVFPALLKISWYYKINLYCPEDVFGRLQEYAEKVYACDEEHRAIINDSFTLCSFSRTLDLDTALKRLAPKQIHIQIHCGPIIQNNKYKTDNALLNAVCLGATLIATNDAPYSTIENDRPVCLLADNTPESWENTLRELLDDKRRKELYKNALEYCRRVYSPSIAAEQVIAATKDLPRSDFAEISRRLTAQLQFVNAYVGTLLTTYQGIPNAPAVQVSASPLQTAVMFSTLGRRKLISALKTAIPGWQQSKNRGIYRLLPISLSEPIAPGHYLESRLPGDCTSLKFVLVPSIGTHVLLELASNDSVIQQTFFDIYTVSELALTVPETQGTVRLRIANQTAGSTVRVVQRSFFSKKIFDLQKKQGG